MILIEAKRIDGYSDDPENLDQIYGYMLDVETAKDHRQHQRTVLGHRGKGRETPAERPQGLGDGERPAPGPPLAGPGRDGRTATPPHGQVKVPSVSSREAAFQIESGQGPAFSPGLYSSPEKGGFPWHNDQQKPPRKPDGRRCEQWKT